MLDNATFKKYLNFNQGSIGIAGIGSNRTNERITKRAPWGSKI